MSEQGINRSAILLLSLGEDEAAGVLKYLGPKEVQKIGVAMAGLKKVSREQIEETLEAFTDLVGEQTGLDHSSDYIRTVLTKALGDDRAAHLIGKILKDRDSPGIDHLKWLEADEVAELIRHEHPQIIATILVHLEPDQAGEVLNRFSNELRNDILLRIATLDSVQPAAMQELNEVLSRLLTGSESGSNQTAGGVKAAAEIINFVNGDHEEAIMSTLRDYDAELAQQIEDEMFIFDNLLDIDDKGIQLMLREVQSESLIVALKGASQHLQEKIFKNMSQRAAEMLREDLESKGPVRLSEVENEQKQILQTVKRLAEEGQLVISGKGGEVYV
ncbi:MAG: flagellar motor switch protein FliG [Thiobacillaceae bacterium]